MVDIRSYRASDLDALYDICLRTGDSGQDASPLHNDPKTVGHIYAAPYGVLDPDNVLVAEDAEGVAGYIVGTYDTTAFAARLERDWWPALRAHYDTISPDSLTEADRGRIAAIRQPATDPADIVARYPAHIHMNLLPRLRGQRVGSRLLERWVARAKVAGVPGIHLGASPTNSGGIAFWQKGGFIPLRIEGAAWFGMAL